MRLAKTCFECQIVITLYQSHPQRCWDEFLYGTAATPTPTASTSSSATTTTASSPSSAASASPTSWGCSCIVGVAIGKLGTTTARLHDHVLAFFDLRDMLSHGSISADSISVHQ